MKRGLAAVLVALLCGTAGFFSFRHWYAPAPAAVALAPRPVSPSASAPTVAPRSIPTRLPALQLPDINGVKRSLSDFEGRPLIVNFWASWCAPCRREIPLLQTLRRQYAPDRLEIVGIAIDFQDAVKTFVQNTPIAYPLMIGEQAGLEAVQRFGMDPVLPFSVFADSHGDIVAVKVGELHRDEADAILLAMREVEAGRLALPEARERISARLKALSVARAKAHSPS